MRLRWELASRFQNLPISRKETRSDICRWQPVRWSHCGSPFPSWGDPLWRRGGVPSLTRHYQTVGLYNFVVAHSTLSDDLVYGIAEAVFANQEMMQAHNAAADT